MLSNRKLFALLLLVICGSLLPTPAHAQIGTNPIIYTAINPNGTACDNPPYLLLYGTTTYGCSSNVWTPVGSSSTGLSAPATSPALFFYAGGGGTTSIPNGTGYLVNDGSGGFSWGSGTGATPATINYSNGYSGASTITQQAKNLQSVSLSEFNYTGTTPATCTGGSSEDDSTALTNAMAAAGTVYIQGVSSGTHCYINNVTIPSNTHIICLGGAATGFKHLPSGTTSSMFVTSFASNISIEGCLIDGNTVASSQPAFSIQNSNNVTLANLIFNNVGSSTTLTGAISIFKSQDVKILYNTAITSDTGQFLVDDNGATQGLRLQVIGNHLSGMLTNAILVQNSGSTSNDAYGDYLIQGNDISNLTDEQNGTGQFGNGILITNVLGGEIASNNINGSLWSGIRMGSNSGFANVHDNTIYNTLDNGIYGSEEGGFGNHIHHNHLYNTGGLASTNQSLRIIGIPDILDNNYAYGGYAFGFHCEGCILRNNHAINTPMGFQLGAGSTTGGSIVEGNDCTANQLTGTGGTPNASLPLGQPMAGCFFIDPGTSSSLTEKFDSNNMGSGWQLPVGIIGVNNNVQITNISKATQAVVTLANSDSAVQTVGNQVCFFFVESMTQTNGQCPTVVSVSGLNVTVNMNSTSYTTWVTPTNGSYPSLWGMWNTTTSTPIAGLGNTDRIRNMDIPYSIATSGGVAVGSHFWVTDGACSGGALQPSGSGVWVDKINSSTLACTLNSDGTMSANPGFVAGGPGKGLLTLNDTTSGYNATITPPSGMTGNQSVAFPYFGFTKPTCNAAIEGQAYYPLGANTSSAALQICQNTAASTYAWVTQ